MSRATPLLLAAVLAFAPAALAQTTFSSTDTPIAIPDSPGPGCGPEGTPAMSNIVVAEPGTINDLDIGLDISHTWVGDLIVRLSNGTTTIDLVNQPGDPDNGTGCGAGDDDMIVIVDDSGTAGTLEDGAPYITGSSYTPTDALSAFNGLPAAGTWTLTVIDTGNADTGTINGWDLIVTISTVANEPGVDGAPDTHALSAPQPNPFRGETALTLTVAQSQHVAARVYDALGREVAVLHDSAMASGQPTRLAFDGADLPAGVYLIRIEGETFSDTRRITLQR